IAFDQRIAGQMSATGREVPHHGLPDHNGRTWPGFNLRPGFLVLTHRAHFRLIQWLELEDGAIVVIAHPEGDRICRVIHECLASPCDPGVEQNREWGYRRT